MEEAHSLSPSSAHVTCERPACDMEQSSTCDTRHVYQMAHVGESKSFAASNAAKPFSHLGGWHVLHSFGEAEHTASQPRLSVQAMPMNIHQMIGNGPRPHDVIFNASSAGNRPGTIRPRDSASTKFDLVSTRSNHGRISCFAILSHVKPSMISPDSAEEDPFINAACDATWMHKATT